jgi:hypothetical protein
LPVYDSVLAGSQAREVSALLSQSILMKLGLVDPLVLENLVKSYQISPDISSTLVISDLVALELICREILGEPALAA